jgi:ubiquinone/menaquinone biosynthesis C-methylase UbiE
MTDSALDTQRLARFYEAISPSLDAISTALRAAGVDPDHFAASELYQRDLDCHNLGMHDMLGVLADVVGDYACPGPDDQVLDVGCGLGGPGRFIVDRFGCSVVGVDLLPFRIELAQTLSALAGMGGRTSYRVADATQLAFEDGAFSQVWMLDVGIHIRAKQALFAEIARVMKRGGLFVMHDQTGPLPTTMRPLRREAPYVAPSLPRLIRLVEEAGMRVLTWRDTTGRVLTYFLGLRTMLREASSAGSTPLRTAQRERGAALLDAYIEALGSSGGRTGILVAERVRAS